MRATVRALARAASLVSFVGALGCGARVEGQPQESNTNWLKSCDDSQQCGEDMACECGVCTQRCDELTCPSRLACVAESHCPGSASASCQATCESDEDCDALAANMQCKQGVCVDEVGLTLRQVSASGGPVTSVEPTSTVSVEPTSDDGTRCRYAHVEYAVGARSVRDTCGATTCTCGSDGEWFDCGGPDIACQWASEVRPCSEMFPGVATEDLPSDPVTITSASIQGTNLSLDFSYSGGCKQQDDVVCFAPRAGERYPIFIDLVLIHDSHGDTCDDTLSPQLMFDLSPVTQYYSEAYQSSADIIDTSFGVLGFGDLSCDMRQTASSLQLSKLPLEEASSCESDDDCVIAYDTPSCYAGCGVVVSKEVQAELAAEIEGIDANFCADYEEQCGPVIVPPCTPRNVACIAGKCGEEN